MKVLLVEDDTRFQRSVTAFLEESGHSVRAFHCPDSVAPSAIDWCEVALLDVVMPLECQDGIWFARWLQKNRPTKHVILISASDPRIFSGWSKVLDVQYCDKAHLFDELPKILTVLSNA